LKIIIPNTIRTIIIILVIATTTISCEKDTSTICENLLKQGIADATLLKGEWEFEYYDYTANREKIKTSKE